MSELSERVSREHFWTLTEHIDRHGDDYFTGGCACGGAEDTDTYDDDDGGHAAHVAEVTEAAVRKAIAADIEKAKYRYGRDRQIAMLAAAKIARGET